MNYNAHDIADLHARVQQLEAERDQAKAEAAVLLAAAKDLIAASYKNLDTKPFPQKYGVPYGEMLALINATNSLSENTTAFLAEHERLKANQQTPGTRAAKEIE